MIDQCPTCGGIVRVVIYVPDVLNVLLLQVSVHSLADVDEPVAIAAREPEERKLLGRRIGIRNERRRRFGVRSSREGAEPGEAVQVRQTEVERLSAYHR